MVLDKKGKPHEVDHANRQETEFRAEARRNRLLAEWAAHEMGLVGEAVEAYVRAVVAADLDEPGDADVVRKVLGDFAGKGIDMDEGRLRVEMAAHMDEARRQVADEAAGG